MVEVAGIAPASEDTSRPPLHACSANFDLRSPSLPRTGYTGSYPANSLTCPITGAGTKPACCRCRDRLAGVGGRHAASVKRRVRTLRWHLMFSDQFNDLSGKVGMTAERKCLSPSRLISPPFLQKQLILSTFIVKPCQDRSVLL